MNNSKLEILLSLDKMSIPADGGETYNRLIFAKSPYLLQHSENPVDWREWGEEAFTEARKRDLPLFVSIGYSTCHWCHVMADESFSDFAVAKLLNENFIPVKIDREERPDIDEFYMTASRVLTGSGGWPLNVFIDQERRPFFAITYLPKHPKHKTPGFMDLLGNISSLWRNRRELLFSNGEGINRSISLLTALPTSTERSLSAIAAEAVEHLEEIFDNKFGGFGVAVKFPMPTYLLFLLSRDSNKSPAAQTMAFKSLEIMMNGGIHDHLGGGFHRYTVDQEWIIPHFEKMLYDQAMLIVAYSEAYTISKEQRFFETALKTARFAVNELLTTEGGFCAGLDADSEGEEGLYYTWTYEELCSLLGKDYKLTLEYWGARSQGDLDGRCILHQTVDPEKFAAQLKKTPEELLRNISNASARLLAVRGGRERPLRDTKVICSWNGLMITALIKIYKITGEKEWLEAAENCAGFILSAMVNSSGRLVRNWLGTASTIAAFAEDYASLIIALSELADVSLKPLWRENIDFFTSELARLFVTETGEVTFCGKDAEKMPMDIPAVQDGVIPSTVALCAISFIRAGKVNCNSEFVEIGRNIIRRYRGVTEKNPAACLSLIMAEEELSGNDYHAKMVMN